MFARKGDQEEKGEGYPKGQKGDREGEGKGDRGQDAVAKPSVIDPAIPKRLDRGISVLCGANLRHLRGGSGLCSPVILAPSYRVRSPFWGAVRTSLLSVCNKGILTSETIRSTNLLNDLNRYFLGKWVGNLGVLLSEFPGKKIDAAVKKPEFTRL